MTLCLVGTWKFFSVEEGMNLWREKFAVFWSVSKSRETVRTWLYDGSYFEKLVFAADKNFKLSGWDLLGIMKHDVIATTV